MLHGTTEPVRSIKLFQKLSIFQADKQCHCEGEGWLLDPMLEFRNQSQSVGTVNPFDLGFVLSYLDCLRTIFQILSTTSPGPILAMNL